MALREREPPAGVVGAHIDQKGMLTSAAVKKICVSVEYKTNTDTPVTGYLISCLQFLPPAVMTM